VPNSLDDLESRREVIARQFAQLGDLRPGSITPTSGRCGKPTCRCHQPGQPGHGPNERLTFKVDGKTVTESLATPAALAKAQREVSEFRKFQQLSHEFVEVSAHICRLRPVEEPALSAQEKKRPRPSAKRSRAK
jgi:hypothetical protein